MTAQAGRLWALSILSGGSYVPVAGLKTRSFKVNNTNVDVTTADSQGRWQELLGGAGVQSLEIDASGRYQQDATAKLLFQAAATSTLQTMRLASPGIQIDATFLVDSYESSGPFDDATDFTVKLMSSGQPTFTYS
ncbi:TP901-1 family phage major tail protein [Methylosinus sp. sav-2]|uniref:phage tail tube protein n=1 Tax=Methylosinus sp. sav-2 TaxID=2485168 RepID=UPI000689319D|nr:phage tail tube protein [Methylosinus sp. sav-2]TDX61926.1 TP901-1 family phage major tail protein [Methylosinus sp. sav-2]